MFKVSVEDYSFGLLDTSSSSTYSYPSLGAILEAISISHCASQLPVRSEERHKMIRSLRQMQNTKNSHETDNDNTALTKTFEREQQGNDALILASTTSSASVVSASTSLFPLIVDPYRVLQVRRDATSQEIRHAYRRLSLWHHPGRSIHIETTTSNNNSNNNSDNGAECAERYRRCQVFEILAACYETLLDKESRRRCDGLLRDVELERKQKDSAAGGGIPILPAGDIRVGQVKIKAAAPISPRAAIPIGPPAAYSLFQRIPTLTPASSSGSSLEGADLPDRETLSLLTQQRSNHASQQQLPQRDTKANAHPFHLLASCGIVGNGSDSSDQPQLLSLVKKSTSSTTDANNSAGASKQYSETETNRLYGGPLQLLYRSRRWKPFMDPLQLFAQVFGSRAPLGILPEKDWSEWKKEAAAAAAATAMSMSSASAIIAAPTVTRSAAWTGSSETLFDGTVVFTTCRTLNDRIMTRTETVRTDKMGRKNSYVSVTSETALPIQGDLSAADAKAKQLSGVDCQDCHVLESCMFFYKDHCGGTTAAATLDTLDKTKDHSHACYDKNSSAALDDEITSVETDGSEADGCHALGACLVWNSAASAEDDNMFDDGKQTGEYAGTNKSASPSKGKDSREAVDNVLIPQSWGLCGQWFPE